MAASPTIPYLEMKLNDLKAFLKPSEKGKTLVLIIEKKEYKVVGKALVPMRQGETGLFQKINMSTKLATAKLLLKSNTGDNLKVFLDDGYLYEIIDGKTPLKIAKKV